MREAIYFILIIVYAGHLKNSDNQGHGQAFFCCSPNGKFRPRSNSQKDDNCGIEVLRLVMFTPVGAVAGR